MRWYFFKVEVQRLAQMLASCKSGHMLYQQWTWIIVRFHLARLLHLLWSRLESFYVQRDQTKRLYLRSSINRTKNMWRVKQKIVVLPRPDGSAWDSMKAYFKKFYMWSYFAKQFIKIASASPFFAWFSFKSCYRRALTKPRQRVGGQWWSWGC